MKEINWLKCYEDPEILNPSIEYLRRSADFLERTRNAIRAKDFPGLGIVLQELETFNSKRDASIETVFFTPTGDA